MEITTNLAEFGFIELEEAIKLLSALIDNGLPEDFDNKEVILMFNKDSGNVFFTNAEYQVAYRSEDNTLYREYYCQTCGLEDELSSFLMDETRQICNDCFLEETKIALKQNKEV